MTFDPNARPAPDQPSYAALLRQLQEAQTEVKQLKRTKKFGLVWEDKPDAQVERVFLEAPLLCEDREKAVVTDEDAVNHVLINGDNFHALTALRATHTGKVDVIYIDPPYNTGNKDFIYNDDYVDSEDGYRHSKWLSFIEKRLRLAKELLADTGVIFVSIDDNEQARLKLLLDGVFGADNFVATMAWRKKATNGGMSKSGYAINNQHEYVHVYAKCSTLSKWNGVKGSSELEAKYKLSDSRGRYRLIDLAGYGLTYQESLDYSIVSPDGTEIRANDVMGVPYKARWRWGKKKYEANRELIVWVDGKPKTKTYISEDGLKVHPSTLLIENTFLSNTDTTMKRVFGVPRFDNPKPVELMKRLLSISTQRHSVILDFFAGSGTTAHAVAELNKEDGGRRQCILVTDGGKTESTGHSGSNANDNAVHIAEEITYERVRRVLTGQDWADGKEHEPLGGNLRYFNVHMENIQSYSERDEAAAFAPSTCSHASLATSAFTVVEEKRVDTAYGLPIDYTILSAPVGEDEVKYVVAVHAHDYELAELGEWFAALPEDTDVTIMGHWLEEVEWIKANTARIKLVDVMEQVSASRKHAKSLVYT